MQNVLVLDDNPGIIVDGFSKAGYQVTFFDKVEKFDQFLLSTKDRFQYIFLDFYISQKGSHKKNAVAFFYDFLFDF